MKKIKHYALGLLGAALVTAGVIACSSEEANTTQQETAVTAWNKSGSTFTGGLVAKVVNGAAVPLYDVAKVKSEIIADGTFKTIETIDLAYGFNPDTKLQEAFITVIGVENTSANLAITIDLNINGDQLIIPDPATNQQAFSVNICSPKDCGSCLVDRTWFLGRVKGCKPCGQNTIDGVKGTCNHTQITGGGSGAIQAAINLAKNAAAAGL